ncbi:MAG: signal peptidase II [Chloroflexi bacterium]|nr:signal peptidase II [Chloroflexota bacterium]
MSTGHVARMRSWHPWAVFLGIASVVFVLDQLSKAWVEATFWLASVAAPPDSPAAPTPVIGDLVRIARTWNDGGIFGLFGSSATILGLASLVVVGVIVWVQATQGARNPLLTVALGLLLGGAVGNLVDRLRLGYVVDWVDMGIGELRFYTFNVADAAVSIAVVLLIGMGLLGTRLGWLVGAGSSDTAGADGGVPGGPSASAAAPGSAAPSPGSAGADRSITNGGHP